MDDQVQNSGINAQGQTIHSLLHESVVGSLSTPDICRYRAEPVVCRQDVDEVCKLCSLGDLWGTAVIIDGERENSVEMIGKVGGYGDPRHHGTNAFRW